MPELMTDILKSGWEREKELAEEPFLGLPPELQALALEIQEKEAPSEEQRARDNAAPFDTPTGPRLYR